MLDLTGHAYGRLTVLSRAEKKLGSPLQRWNCVCECGKHTVVTSGHLRSNHTTSCGCYQLERIRSQLGGTGVPGYNSWKNIVNRCTNPKYKDYSRYGGAGISICYEWRYDFQAFISHIGPRPTKKHSVDRIDNTRGYYVGNVKWSTAFEQQANKNNTLFVLYEGEKKALCLLPRHASVSVGLIAARVFRSGWSVEKALTTPALVRSQCMPV